MKKIISFSNKVIKKLMQSPYIFCILLALFTFNAYSHSGRTDSNGGHWDRSTGTYHYHTGEYAGQQKSATQSSEQDTDEELIERIHEYRENHLTSQSTPYYPYKEETYPPPSEDDNHSVPYLRIITSTIVFLLVVLRIRYSFKDLNEDINTYEKRLNEYISCKEKFNKLKQSELRIPPEYAIGSDGLPKEADSWYWGESLTLYRTTSGSKLHQKFGCSNATTKTHICKYYHNLKKSSSLCQICSKDYKIPDLTWYQNRLNYKHTEKKLLELRVMLFNSYKECNTYHRTALKFSRKNRKKLIILNKESEKLQSEN